MSSLLDQSPLVDLAQRLVEAARRAGADAADAVAVRSASLAVEVRDAAVEESERAEADDLGLRVLVGRRQAVVSTNDLSEDGVANLAERAVAILQEQTPLDEQQLALAQRQLGMVASANGQHYLAIGQTTQALTRIARSFGAQAPE